MKERLILISIALIILLFVNDFACAGGRWRVIKGGKSSELFGKPFEVLNVSVTKEVIKENKVYYSYKFIIHRPSNDDGWGRAQMGPIRFRLHYWAAQKDVNVFTTTYRGGEVFQNTHQDSKKIVVHLLHGLEPGRHKIQLAIFPYPMYTEYRSFKDMVQFYRGPYVTYFKALGKALAITNPYAAGAVLLTEVAKSKARDDKLDAIFINIANEYGQLVELDVMAKMPEITMQHAEEAAKMLKIRSLIPNPDYRNVILTNDKTLHNKVARSEYKTGQRLAADTKVSYKFYKYDEPPLEDIIGEWESSGGVKGEPGKSVKNDPKRSAGQYVVWIHPKERRCCSSNHNGVAPYAYHGTKERSMRSGSMILGRFSSKEKMIKWVCDDRKVKIANYHQEAWAHIGDYVVKNLPCPGN